MVTPVNHMLLGEMLRESQYPEDETKFLVEGFEHGFDIGYVGDDKVKITAPNLKFRGVRNEVILWNKVMKEVQLGHYAGPFKDPPFEYYIQSPIGLVPKDGGRNTRLIFHLSYPWGEGSTNVNANTPAHLCKVKYPDFSEAVKLCMNEGVNCKIAKIRHELSFQTPRTETR